MGKIALACSGLGHVRRGNETWARTVAEALCGAGESVRLYGGGPLPEIRCPYQRIWNIPRDWFGWRRLLSWGRRYAYEQQLFARALAWHLRGAMPEIVHTADPVLAYRLSLLAGRLGFRLIYKDGLLLGPHWCGRFDWVQVLAPHYLEEAARAGVKTDRWFVIPHLVDAARFAPAADRGAAVRAVLGPEVPENAFVVLSAGAFDPESNKRLEWVIQEVISLGPDSGVHLVLAGQAEAAHVALLENLCRPLGNRAHLRPNISPQQMPDYYRAADAFALANLREPFGIVFIEAMASGLPTVGHTFPVTQWIIGPGGTAIDMTKPGELAGVLEKWRREPALRADLAAAARARAIAEFSPSRIVPLYQQMYTAVRAGGNS